MKEGRDFYGNPVLICPHCEEESEHPHPNGWPDDRNDGCESPTALDVCKAIVDAFSRDGEFNAHTSERSIVDIRAMAETVIAREGGGG